MSLPCYSPGVPPTCPHHFPWSISPCFSNTAGLVPVPPALPCLDLGCDDLGSPLGSPPGQVSTHPCPHGGTDAHGWGCPSASLLLPYAMGWALVVRPYLSGTLCCSWVCTLTPRAEALPVPFTLMLEVWNLREQRSQTLTPSEIKSVSQKGKQTDRNKSLPRAFHMLRNGLGDAEIMSWLGFSDEREILETPKWKKSLENFFYIIIMMSFDIMLISLFLT